MAKAGQAVQESLDAVGRSATETRQLLRAVLSGDADYRLVELNASTYQVVRTAQVLLMRKVETCTFTIADGSRGAVLTIAGRLLPDRLDRLRTAIADRARTMTESAPPAPAPALTPLTPLPGSPYRPPFASPASGELVSSVPAPRSVDVSAPVGSPSDETMFRQTPAQRSPAPPSPAPPSVIGATAPPVTLLYELRFDNGETWALTQTIVIGRDPSIGAAGKPAERVVLDDVRVSKAHASLGVDEQGPWVEDLHSTNGTFVHVHGQEIVSVLGGQRHRLEAGSVIRFGTRFVTLSRAD